MIEVPSRHDPTARAEPPMCTGHRKTQPSPVSGSREEILQEVNRKEMREGNVQKDQICEQEKVPKCREKSNEKV